MILYLSSFKLGNKADFLRGWVRSSLKNRPLALITNARDLKPQDNEEAQKLNANINLLEEIGFTVDVIDLRKYFNQRYKLYECMSRYNSICVIGGNIFTLRKAMQLSGFDEYIVKNKNRDNLLYIGYSAGSCVLSPNLDGFQYVDTPINPYNSEEVIYSGLGLLEYCYIPHYKSNHKESEKIDHVVKYLTLRREAYRTFRDGNVLILHL